MPIVSSIPRLLGAFLLAIVMSPALAYWDETPEVAWKEYLSDCEGFQQVVNNVQNGTMTTRQAMNRVDSLNRTVYVHRDQLSPASLASAEYARCENVIAQAFVIRNKEEEVFVAELQQQYFKAQAEHEKSPEYKRALALGFSDVGGIGKLKELAEESETDGEAYLKTLMITVDWGCGRHFRAVRYVKPYVIYTAHPDEGSCAVYKEVAVLGGERVERGETLDQDAIFQYVGWKTLEGAGGFPVDIRVVKVRK
ncbi:hypothetical protein PS876_01284 [Pseudomonas fluorescens]|uniref:hypothetical protein n=1 Tax=Pseudomonas fluorescens TaxID=294 RepID=UPI001240B757|nr:hypothetical protein [Pseudomonas fluorescens]VVO70925.1 hypothetical protein PS876_01284 [Pseudomonas fluorescens]